MNAKPTKQAYNELQTAYDFFNRKLFKGQLPPCLITMQRKNRTLGYFSGNRWADRSGDITDEIAMNPMHFAKRGVEDVLSTLVHDFAARCAGRPFLHRAGRAGRLAVVLYKTELRASPSRPQGYRLRPEQKTFPLKLSELPSSRNKTFLLCPCSCYPILAGRQGCMSATQL